MYYLTDNGFVLKRKNFGEADRFISIFTKNNGKVDVIAKGVRKLKSRRAPSLELLNLIRFQAVKSTNNFILTEVELIDSFEHLKKELLGMERAFLICELIERLTPHEQKNYQIFQLIENTLEKIIKEGNDNRIKTFQTELLFMLGYWDKKRAFSGDAQLRRFIENILEKKIKTKAYFKI